MDFNAKRLALLAGVGNSEDRHDIVREYAQQLNESAEARQLNEAEEAVRKAVRRTIQKMISEGNLDFANTGITGGSVHVMEEEELSEDSIDDELDNLHKNVKDDVDHIKNLKKDIEDDREEEERARKAKDRKDEGAEEDLNEDEDEVVDNPGAKAADDPSRKGDHRGAYDLKESDSTLRRLQALAGLQILAEGRDEDVEEAHCSEDEDHMEEGQDPEVTDGEMVPSGSGPDPRSMAYEGEDHDEAKLYELEDGTMYMEMGGKKFMMQEMEEELNELEEEDAHYVGKDPDGNDVVSVDGKLGRVQ